MAEQSQAVEDSLYELEIGSHLQDSRLFNNSIAPTRIKERNWTSGDIAALWVGMAICVPTYTLGGVLTAFFGLSVIEALITILLANTIVLIPLCLNAFPGTKYGIPFPVVLRSSFGTIGSNLPCMIRATVACGWFGVQTLFGGIAVHLLFSSFSSDWANLGETGEVIGFFIFMLLNLVVVIRGADSVKKMEAFSAPLLLVVSVGLMMWIVPRVDIVALVNEPANRPADTSLWSYFFGGLTAMVGFWATLSLNIPDFSRYARSQKDQIKGQVLGLPLTMFFFSALGVVMTAATPSLFGHTISDPVHLIGMIDNTTWKAMAMVLIIIATLSTNTAANIVSPTNDFQNLSPRHINHTRGVILTGFIGLLLMGFELLKKVGWLDSDISIEAMYSGWLLSYSSLLGPIAGIMVVDYFFVRRQVLSVEDLYLPDGVYPKVNMAGMAAFLVPGSLSVFAMMTGSLAWFYHYGWFCGSLIGGALYALFNIRQLTRASA
ncbi:NCS1 family nucleobase:cation symporter-1 [Endozoicomonas elysicola]|uniref:Nitrate reductase n=1 Tax=Endozoicomonas elysicola TaxID=305900 RepID=A0A081KDK9_9GAMM|nr:NCS1 family nucleobase:cation symporter-1 [Endozoicomonas elysicola]KEI72235.1 nitrate reductase [Endozoicomonas elysicola]